MKEEDYINVSDLQRIRMAKDILSNVIVENQDNIKHEDFYDVMSTILMWEDVINKKIQVR